MLARFDGVRCDTARAPRSLSVYPAVPYASFGFWRRLALDAGTTGVFPLLNVRYRLVYRTQLPGAPAVSTPAAAASVGYALSCCLRHCPTGGVRARPGRGRVTHDDGGRADSGGAGGGDPDEGNFRLLHRLLTQVERILRINERRTVTSEVVEAAREGLVIGPV